MTIDPNTGRPKVALKLQRPTAIHACGGVFPRDGGFLAYFHSHQDDHLPPGLYAIDAVGKTKRTVATPDKVAHDTVVKKPAVSADGRFAACIVGGKATVWDLHAGKQIFAWSRDYYWPSECAFVGDRVVVSHSNYQKWTYTNHMLSSIEQLESRFEMYETATGRAVKTFQPSAFKLPSLRFAFSPNGRYLALADHKAVALLDAEVAFAER